MSDVPVPRSTALTLPAWGSVRQRLSGVHPLIWASGALAGLVALPILTVFAIATQHSTTFAHLAQTTLPELIGNTALLMVLVGIGVTAVGVSTAWLVTMCQFRGSRTLEWLLLLPLAMPAYIIGYAYTDFLTFAGPLQTGLRETFGWSRPDYWFPDIHSLWGVAIMLTLVLYPYVYFLTRTAFLNQSECAMEAARTLGQGPWACFRRVALPLARPAIAAGVALALMETLADFGTVQYFGVNTFTTAIYRSWFGMGDRVAAAQLAMGLLMFVFLLIAMEQISRRQRRFHHTSKRLRPLSRHPLTGWQAGVAMGICAAPVLLGFVLPVLMLVRLNLEGGEPFFSARFGHYAWNSFTLAGLSAVVVVAAAFLIAYTTRIARNGYAQATVKLATLGYAIPGSVIAVGILVPLGQLDRALDGFARAEWGVSTGLLLSGTLVALIFAYLVRFLAVAHGTLDAGLHRIPHSIDHAARTLGCTQAGVVGRIHLPLLRRSALTAAIIVFVDVLKELPATLIVRPFNFDTLAVRVYQLASDERLAQASTGALVIVAVGIIPVIILTRMMSADSETRRSAL